MIKAAHLSLGLAALLILPAAMRAQDSNAATNNAVSLAVNQAVLDQYNTRVLHEKLDAASATAQRGDTIGAVKLYQECVKLGQQIGPSAQTETAQAIAGLTSTSLALGRAAQSQGDYNEADIRVQQVLSADPKNSAALAFKLQNDQMIKAMAGRLPDQATMSQVPQMLSQKTQAATLAQDGKVFYEMSKFDEAEQKLSAALKLDPDNAAALEYLNLIQQARFARASTHHTVEIQKQITSVEKEWVQAQPTVQLPAVGNAYATNTLTYTGPGRQAIIQKLNSIRLDNVSYDGLPLSEVVRQLQDQSKLRDPEHKGINFLINPNADQSGPAIAVQGGGGPGGFGGGGGFGAGIPGAPAAQAAIDPNTGLPIASTTANGGGEKVDIGNADTVKLQLGDVRLADLLDAIVMIADHPDGHQLKYSIEDFGVVFSDKGAESPLLFIRTFKVDPNTFYSGLESVSSTSFGSTSTTSGGGGGIGGGGGGGSSGQNSGGSVVGVVNAFAGSGQVRSSLQSTTGGGGGGNAEGAVNPLNSGQATQGAGGAGAGGGAGGNLNGGGLNYVTQVTLTSTPSQAARAFFAALGVNLTAPVGKAIFFNDRTGILLVRATEQDLDTIDKAIQVMNTVSPQVNIKSRFIEVSQTDNKQLGFDWDVGQFSLGNQAVGTGGTSPSLTVPVSQANPLGAFPGNTAASLIAGSATDQQLFSSGLAAGTAGATTATITGILTNPNFQVVLHALETRSGVEDLGEPSATTMSGRQTQMRATTIRTVVIGITFTAGTPATTTGTAGGGGGAGGL
jgi:tetratricopeptide (TPR) repeat protein